MSPGRATADQWERYWAIITSTSTKENWPHLKMTSFRMSLLQFPCFFFFFYYLVINARLRSPWKIVTRYTWRGRISARHHPAALTLPSGLPEDRRRQIPRQILHSRQSRRQQVTPSFLLSTWDPEAKPSPASDFSKRPVRCLDRQSALLHRYLLRPRKDPTSTVTSGQRQDRSSSTTIRGGPITAIQALLWIPRGQSECRQRLCGMAGQPEWEL